MKLETVGLLVVVVGLLPVVHSERRFYTQCELKEELEQKLTLPELDQAMKEKVAALIVCRLNPNHLWTNWNRTIGRPRSPLIKTPPAVICPYNSATDDCDLESSGDEWAFESSSDEWDLESSSDEWDLESSGDELDLEFSGDEPDLESSGVVWDLESSGDEWAFESSSDEWGSGLTNEDKLEIEENKFDEMQMVQDDNNPNGESSENPVQWSLGYFGLFELSDSHFCCSGHRWSRNKCNTTCSAFVDNDLTDDIDCLIKTNYWGNLCLETSLTCADDLIKKCKEAA